jgi:hypothetical protein
VVAHALARCPAHSLRERSIGEEPGDRSAERRKIGGIDQHAALAVDDLILDAADPRGDDRA